MCKSAWPRALDGQVTLIILRTLKRRHVVGVSGCRFSLSLAGSRSLELREVVVVAVLSILIAIAEVRHTACTTAAHALHELCHLFGV